jgi:hypothetical protein
VDGYSVSCMPGRPERGRYQQVETSMLLPAHSPCCRDTGICITRGYLLPGLYSRCGGMRALLRFSDYRSRIPWPYNPSSHA